MERRAAPCFLPVQGPKVPARPLLRVRPPARLDRGPGEASSHAHPYNSYLGYTSPLPACVTHLSDRPLSRLYITALLARFI